VNRREGGASRRRGAPAPVGFWNGITTSRGQRSCIWCPIEASTPHPVAPVVCSSPRSLKILRKRLAERYRRSKAPEVAWRCWRVYDAPAQHEALQPCNAHLTFVLRLLAFVSRRLGYRLDWRTERAGRVQSGLATVAQLLSEVLGQTLHVPSVYRGPESLGTVRVGTTGPNYPLCLRRRRLSQDPSANQPPSTERV
jgi:hypothetical protein